MLNKNPTIIISGLSGLIQQLLPLLVILDVVHLTPERLAAVIAAQGLVFTFVATTLLNSQTTATALADQQIRTAVRSEIGTSVEEVKKEVEKANG